MTYASVIEYLCIKMIHGAYLHRDLELVALLCFTQIFKCYCYVKIPVLEFQSIDHGFVAYHRLFRICFFLDSIVLLRLPCKIFYCTNSLHGASTYLLFFFQFSSLTPSFRIWQHSTRTCRSRSMPACGAQMCNTQTEC